uniref:Uncharacterized protein n=1 Tax=uncultured marine virus TaxID=186617 RepID=A0A0F7L6Z1_9VIRU|nr:hypothetical protein [uncultured marine virus]
MDRRPSVSMGPSWRTQSLCRGRPLQRLSDRYSMENLVGLRLLTVIHLSCRKVLLKGTRFRPILARALQLSPIRRGCRRLMPRTFTAFLSRVLWLTTRLKMLLQFLRDRKLELPLSRSGALVSITTPH